MKATQLIEDKRSKTRSARDFLWGFFWSLTLSFGIGWITLQLDHANRPKFLYGLAAFAVVFVGVRLMRWWKTTCFPPAEPSRNDDE